LNSYFQSVLVESCMSISFVIVITHKYNMLCQKEAVENVLSGPEYRPFGNTTYRNIRIEKRS